MNRRPYHLCQTPCGGDVSGVHQSVEMPRRLLYLLAHLVIAVEVEHVSDEVQSILIVCDVRVQAGEVEAVCQVVFIDFAKVLITPRRDKLHRCMLARYI